MNNPEGGADRRRATSRLGSSWGIVAIFLVIGPPVATVVLWLEAIAIDWWRGRDVWRPGTLQLLGPTLLFSYPVGAPFALLAGIAQALATVALRWRTVWVPVSLGCATAAVATAVVISMLPQSEFQSICRQFVNGVQLFLAPSLAACLVCWKLSRGAGP